MSIIIPEKSISQHVAILGKAGSGKTYAAKGVAEHLLARGSRVCIVDPTGVWWGLRSKENGKKSAFPIVIFGGKHHDVALHESQGKAIAEIVGTTDTSAIIDTRQMSVGERTRFFTDFAETLLQKNQGPLHLIIDEAHVFAPQGRVNDPQSGKMLGATNNLVSLGRAAGLRVMLITQRPAKLHKDSLTQAETLIAMRLIAPQDRNAVRDWVEEWAEPVQGKELMQSLPSLPTGEGWIWAPEQGVLKRVKFPKITTYDSSSTPDGKRAEVVLANIDLATIQSRLEVVAKETLENDPKRLRAQIAELQKMAKKVVPAAPAVPDEIALYESEQKGWGIGFEAGYDFAIARLTEGRGAQKAISRPPAAMPKIQVRVLKPTVRHQKPQVVPASGPGESMAAAERKFLTVLAQRGQALARNKIAIFAGYSVKSGHIDNTLGGLRSKGWAVGGNSGVRITDAGLKALGSFEPMPSGEELRAYWLREVDKAGSTFLKILFDVYPDTISRNDLAEKAGYSPSSGHVDNTLGRLRSLDLAEGRNDGIKASDDLFQEAA